MADEMRSPGADGQVRPPEQITWQGLREALERGWGSLHQTGLSPGFVRAAMIAILLLAGALRFTGLDWDEHQHLHPDERFLTMVENSLSWPESFGQYLDTAANPLNPYNWGHPTYVYGLFPVVVAKFFGQVVGKTGYDGVYLVGRALSAIMDMATIVLVFLIGRRLYDARVGLLGALLLSLSVLSIQQSHFFTVDNSTTLFVTLALYYAVRVAQGEGFGSVLMLGVAFGFAVAAKISVLSFLLIICLAYALRVAAGRRGERDGDPLVLTDLQRRWGRTRLHIRVDSGEAHAPWTETDRLLLKGFCAAGSVLLVLLVAFVGFRIAQPQAFTGPGFFGLKVNDQWKADMDYVRKLVGGEIDYPPSHQWTARAPVWYCLKNMVLWGLGLPLGLAVWAGWALMARELLVKRKWEHLLIWVWVSFTFAYQSIQFVKPMRYLLPIYPAMALMAGYGLIRLGDWARRARVRRAREPWRRWASTVASALVVVIVVGTALWAVAFTGIYTRPVSRVAASRWIYRNIPRGSSISFEMWDDPLPLNVDGLIGGDEYHTVQMEPYWEDTPEKREKLLSWLEQTEYICLSSNRLYGSIPRLPTRFPMTTRYYQALFSGELGYDHLITFTSRPRLFGIEIADDDADESFTVYDHPKVMIFKKRSDFSLSKVRELFSGYDLERIVRVTPRQATGAPNALMLGEDQWAIQRAGGTWSRLFNRDSLSNRLPTLTWLLVLFLVGAAAFPLGFVAFRRLRDRGYLLSKTLGVLLLGYLSWLLPSLKLLPYTRATIVSLLAALGLVSGVVAWVQRRALGSFVRSRWRLLLMNELLFLAFFTVFWLVRWGNPDLWHPAMGGEKPMDMAYLNAIIKSSYFPPYDPWFAGGHINYYYLGLVMVASLVKLTAIVPSVAYNLAIPTFFALTAMGACCVTFNLVSGGDDEGSWMPRALRYGLLGAGLVAVVGNLGEVQLLWNGLQELGRGLKFESTIPGLAPLTRSVVGLWSVVAKGKGMPFRPEWWYWNATRVMKHGEINEFPFFTFLYADLHAHLTALPITLLALGLAIGFVVKPVAHLSGLARDWSADEGAAARRRWWRGLVARWRGVDWAVGLRLGLLALAVGELWCGNSWDYPTYLGIAVVALAIGVYGDRQRIDQGAVARFALRAGAVVALSVLLYWPFHAHFGSAYSSVEAWKGERTPLGAYLIIHGAMLFILASYLVAQAFEPGTRNPIARAVRLFVGHRGRTGRTLRLYHLLVRRQSLAYELAWLGLATPGLIVLALLASKAWVGLLVVPLLVLAGAVVLRRQIDPVRRVQVLLVGVGLALTLGVEYVVIKGDVGRMNTVFKFYLQVWVLWGIVAAAALAYLLRVQHAWSAGPRRAWRTVLVALLVGVSLYPVLASRGKVRDRWDPALPGGLEGTDYMRTATYYDADRPLTLEWDRRAIAWLQDHVEGSPVIAEASVPPYRWGSRVSIYTGLPTIIGWDWHQKQQRAAVGGVVIDWRIDDLRDLYNSQDIEVAATILRRYRVGYIYVGELERAYYDPEGLAKFEAMEGSGLQIAYRQGPVTIYRVEGSGAREVRREDDPWLSRQDQPSPTALERLRDWVSRNWIRGPVRAEGPLDSTPGSPRVWPGEPTLMLDRPVDQLPVLDDRGWNRVASHSTVASVAVWWLVLELIGLAAWPLVACFCLQLGDGGYGLSKGIGLILVSYLVWIGSSLRWVANSPPVAWLALAALGGFSLVLWRVRPGRLRAVWGTNRRIILLEEGLFTAAFLAFVGLRLLNPDLWHPWFGGEKMMEIALLNAITRSAHMPPYDPFFAGGYVNYYYYGHFMVALLTKLTGLVPEVAFNLAVPSLFALTILHSFAVGYWVVVAFEGDRRLSGADASALGDGSAATVAGPASPPTMPGGEGDLVGAVAADPAGSRGDARQIGGLSPAGLWAGAGAVALVALAANMSAVVQLVEGLGRIGGASFNGQVTWGDVSSVLSGLGLLLRGKGELPAFDYWYRATRIIPNTINEFPFFSFLFADLHPHMMSIPFTLLVAGLYLVLVRDEEEGRMGAAIRWAVVAIAVGALGVINTWDLPAYLGGLGCVLLYRGLVRGGWRGMVEGALISLLLAVASLGLYVPFYLHYWAPNLSLALVPPASRTRPSHFVAIWALQLFLVASLLIAWVVRDRPWERVLRLVGREASRGLIALRWILGLVVLGGIAAVCWLGRDMPVVVLLGFLLAVVGILLARSGRDEAVFLQRLMLFIGLGLLLGVELVYVRDWLADSEWLRMNTVFKFYIQAWVLIGLALGAALPGLWRRIVGGGRLGAVAWCGVLGLLVASSALYVVLAVPARVSERFPDVRPRSGTLDGMAYMAAGVYHWPDQEHPIELKYDLEAIRWLLRNVEGTPVIAEAPLGYYREGGLRVSSYTGLPTIVGAHESEQRPRDQVSLREGDAAEIYRTTDVEALQSILSRYRVRYIYVGQLERNVFPGPGLAKFERLSQVGVLARVHHNDGVDIYEVSGDWDSEG